MGKDLCFSHPELLVFAKIFINHRVAQSFTEEKLCATLRDSVVKKNQISTLPSNLLKFVGSIPRYDAMYL